MSQGPFLSASRSDHAGVLALSEIVAVNARSLDRDMRMIEALYVMA